RACSPSRRPSCCSSARWRRATSTSRRCSAEMDFGGLAISLAFSVGACAGGGWWCIRRLSEARFLLNTPTSKIRSAAQGYVELYGTLDELPGGQLEAPLTGTACLWWRFRIE